MVPEAHDIVEFIRERRPAALEKAIDLYFSSVYGVTKSILAGIAAEEDIEECVQDVFMNAWNNIEKFDERRGSFKTWLLLLCRSRALNLRKLLLNKNKTIDYDDIQVSGEEDTEGDYLLKEEKDEIIKEINSFSEKDREIFIRRYLMDQSIEYISEIMKLSRPVIDTRLWRGRKKLKEAFNKNGRRIINE